MLKRASSASRRLVQSRAFQSPLRATEQQHIDGMHSATLWTEFMQTMYRHRNPLFGSIWGRIDAERLRHVQRTGAVATACEEERLVNDHVALRTFNLSPIGLGDFHRPLIEIGFEPREQFHFEEKSVRARWYAPPPALQWLPRIFVSELLVDKLSLRTQRTIERVTRVSRLLRRTSTASPIQSTEKWWRAALGLQFAHELDAPLLVEPLKRSEYDSVSEETEYGAWTLINGNRINHCTIPVHTLRAPYNQLENFMRRAEEAWSVEFFNSGAIQTSADGLLKQSSTPAQLVPYVFAGESVASAVPGSFVEFIERRREGFEMQNANRIFESTSTKR